MKKNELYVYTALSLATLVPVPGRLAYGIVIIVMLYLLSLLGILFKQFVSMFFEYGLRSVLIAAMLISTCLLVRQILIIISPITAFILGINIYVPALTAFILGNLYRHSGLKLSEMLNHSLGKCISFSIFALFFFIIREIISYGTISLPCASGLIEFQIINENSLSFMGFFWGSMPGAVVLLAIMIAVIASAMKKIEILVTSERSVK